MTAPKGRPTGRSAAMLDERALRRADRIITLQWIAVGVAVVAAMVLVIVLVGDPDSIPTRRLPTHQRPTHGG
ncbi:MAG: hypothetical protein HY826_11415 [Actinobacteria bacterium]|nr:hypothetical protein [Actinomycetota bacterium]